MIEVPEEGMINIPGLGALPIRPRGGTSPAGMGKLVYFCIQRSATSSYVLHMQEWR